MNNQQFKLVEGLEMGDLKRLVNPDLHIDEFVSKMGADKDVIVVSFKVDGKEPAKNLMKFFESGYDWLLDADTSSGEMDDGSYLVFIELERSPESVDDIITLVDAILNLTGQDITEWKFQYRKNSKKYDITAENLSSVIPLTPAEYSRKYKTDDITAMQETARIKINKKAPVNEWTEQLRIAAGIK
jgi:hypothetical protein